MNNTVTANDLKVKGISVLDAHAKKGLETVITVRGQEKYVILTKKEYSRLRECELTAALVETKNDLKEGKYHDSIEKHLKALDNV